MSKTVHDLGDLIKIDAKVIAAIKSKNADKVKSVLDRKSARVVEDTKAQEARDNAFAVEFEALQGSAEDLELMQVYGAQVQAAVEPIGTLDAIEANITADVNEIKARYADALKEAQAAVDISLHDVREARVAVESLDMYPSIIASDEITHPLIAARLHKRGRGRGGGGGSRTPDFEAGDTVYLQHTDKITGERYVWQSVATATGIMVNGEDTANSTATFDLRTGVDDALREMADPPYHPGKAWKAYPPAGRAYEGVEAVNIE